MICTFSSTVVSLNDTGNKFLLNHNLWHKFSSTKQIVQKLLLKPYVDGSTLLFMSVVLRSFFLSLTRGCALLDLGDTAFAILHFWIAGNVLYREHASSLVKP